MVRETRHLWVGNLPDNIREERILEHFKRYGRVQSVKLLPRGSSYGQSSVQQQHNNHLHHSQHNNNNNSNNSNPSAPSSSSTANLTSSGATNSTTTTTSLLPPTNVSPSNTTSPSNMSPWPPSSTPSTPPAATSCCCTVAFMDIKSAAKALAHTGDHKLDDRTLTTEYYEPAALHHKQQVEKQVVGGLERGVEKVEKLLDRDRLLMMTPSSSQLLGDRGEVGGSGGSTPTSCYSTSPGAGAGPGGSRFPNGHSTVEDLHPFGLSASNATSTNQTSSSGTPSGTPDRFLHTLVRRSYNHHDGRGGVSNSQRHRDRLGGVGGVGSPAGAGSTSSGGYHSHRTSNGPTIVSGPLGLVGGYGSERGDVRQRLGGSWSGGGGYDGLMSGGTSNSRYESTGYSSSITSPSLPSVPSSISTPLDICGTGTSGSSNNKSSININTSSNSSSKSKQLQQQHKSRSRSNSASGSASSRSASRSRSSSSSSSSSSSTEGGGGGLSGGGGANSAGSTIYSAVSPKSRRPSTLSSGSGGNSGSGGGQQTSNSSSASSIVVHSEDRRPLAICVRNLPLRSSDTSLKDGLFHEYKKHGKVTWVKVVGSGSERHAIVCFKKPEDVEKALEVSYDKLFFGCKIEVAPYQGYDVDDNDLRPYEAEIDEFHPKATRTLFIGNLEKDVTGADLRSHFEQFGSIIEIDIKKQGLVNSYAFCQYSDIVSVVRAIRTMDGEHLGNNRVKLGFGKSMLTNCVWIDGVGDAVGEKYLLLQFDPFGVINQVYIDRDRGQSLIFYDAVVSAQAAVTKMRGHNLRGKKIQVDFASRECQDTFFDHLEKQGFLLDRPPERCVDTESSSRVDVVGSGGGVSGGGSVGVSGSGVVVERRSGGCRSGSGGFIGGSGNSGDGGLCTTRFSRYESVGSRPRTASYSGRSGAPPPSPLPGSSSGGGSIPPPQSPSSTGGIAGGTSHRGTPSSRSGRLGGSGGSDRRYSSISSDPYSTSSSNPMYSPPSGMRPSTPTDPYSSHSYHHSASATTGSNSGCYSPPPLHMGAQPTSHHVDHVDYHSSHYHGSPPGQGGGVAIEQHGVVSDHHMMHIVQFAAPDNMRNLQKERVHLLEQLEECPSSGDEVISPKKRMKMEHADGSISSEVVMVEVGGVGSGRDHRKVMEVRRLSDASTTSSSNTPKHVPLTIRRLSNTSNPTNQPSAPSNTLASSTYLPHTICKRRKTASSENGGANGNSNTPQRQHSSNSSNHHNNSNSNYDGGVESGSSRPGTPLCDERPESVPSEPRKTSGTVGTRTERDDKPMMLPLPKFALQLLGRGNYTSVSIGGVKGQKDSQILASPPPAVTSPRSCATTVNNNNKLSTTTTMPSPLTQPPNITPVPASANIAQQQQHVPPPASPPPRPPSLGASSTSSCGGDSDGGGGGGVTSAGATVVSSGGSPSLDERIRSLDERYEKWSGSRAISAAGGDALLMAKLDATRERFKIRHKLLDLDLKEVQPSEIVKSVMAKRSVFDEDTKRLENVGEKYEPRDFTASFNNNSSTATAPVQSTSVPANNSNNSAPIASCSSAAAITTTVLAAVAISVVTPTQMDVPPVAAPVVVTTPAKGLQYPFPSHPPVPTPVVAASTATNIVPASATAVPVRNPPSHGVVVDNRLKSCASVSANGSDNTNTAVSRTSTSAAPIPTPTSKITLPNRINAKSSDTLCKDDNPPPPPHSNSQTKQSNIQVRRNSSTATCEANTSNSGSNGVAVVNKSRRNSNAADNTAKSTTSDNCDNGDRLEKERLEKEQHMRLETERSERERLEKEREERERVEKEKERLEQERIERERLEKEHRRQEREKKEREERERKEKEEHLKKERDEKERKEREDKERREKEEQHRLEQLEKERQDKTEQRRKDKLERERDDNHDKRQSKDHRVIENHKDEIKRDISSVNSTKDERVRENHKSTQDKPKSHTERKDSVKENRENNVYDKTKHLFNEISEVKDRPTLVESHHLSLDLDKKELSKHCDPSRRKERNNSLPATIGLKRRLSDASDFLDEPKKMKLYSEQQHKKLCERRDSKDSSKDEKVKSKHKNSSTKSFEEKVKYNHVKDKDREREREERHRNKHLQRLEKHKKSKSRDKESPTESSHHQSQQLQPKSPKDTITSATTADKDFLSKLDLIEVENQKHIKKEFKERRRHETSEEEHKERRDKHTPMLVDHRTKEEINKSFEERKMKNRIRKLTADSSENNSDSDEPKKHSIFDIVEDEPAYISMYDKVKARSCKNMQKQEEEKKQEKIKAKFNQLKQSRAKREEKKRSTSWDEDSDSDTMRSRKLKPIASSDDDDSSKQDKPKEIYSDSDSDRMRQIKSEPLDSSDEEQFMSINRKGSKSRIASDSSDDDFKNVKNQLKIEMMSDNEEQGFVEVDEKYNKPAIKEEFADSNLFTKDKKATIKTQESFMDLNAQIFGDSSSPILELKQEKVNNSSRVFGDISSADECKEKLENRRKHKKKQKRQKSSISSEEGIKLDSFVDAIHGGEPTDKKNSEKRKHVSKKDKKRDKVKDDDKSKEKSRSKSKKSRSETKDFKRDGKMENIFGSLSDDSEDILKDASVNATVTEQADKLIEEVAKTPISYASDSDNITTDTLQLETKERTFKEEHRKRKEKKRREKEKRLREETAAAAVAVAATVNENSIDFADLGKQLEDNIKDHSNENSSHESKVDVDETAQDASLLQDRFKFTETDKGIEVKTKELKVKKKKRKKSKDEKHRHHHHHHEKNKLKSPEVKEAKKEFVPAEESMPNILDISSPPQVKTTPDNSLISPQTQEALISPLANTPTSAKDKKREKFLPEFDEKVHENAVKSISEFMPTKQETASAAGPVPEQPEVEAKDEKRVVISQEETEDAVAALLGESFCSTSQFEDYTEEPAVVSEQAVATVEENVQDDEEMRQAVQSLKSPELDLKPDTPQSENDLQIDTDTEEQDDSLRFDQPPRTPDMLELSQPPKTPDIPSYLRKEDSSKTTTTTTSTTTTIIVKTTLSPINIGSPPSLTPIKPSTVPTINVEAVKKNLDKTSENKCAPSLPLLPVQPPLSAISAKPWPESSAGEQTKPQPSIVTAKPNYDKVPPLAIQTSAVVSLIGQNKIISPAGSKLDSGDSQKIISLHNMPQQMPSYPISKAQDIQGLLSPKPVTNSAVNRLPITPVMIAKPLQPQTVVLPQAKVAEIRPPLVYHTASNIPRFSATYSPVNVRTQMLQQIPAQRLPVPTQQAVPQRPTLVMSNNLSTAVRQLVNTTAPTLKVIEKPTSILPTSVPQQYLPVPPLVQSSSVSTPPSTAQIQTKPFTPIIKEAPQLVSIATTDMKLTQPAIIQSTLKPQIITEQTSAPKLPSPSLDNKAEVLKVSDTIRTTSPSPVIQVTPPAKESSSISASAVNISKIEEVKSPEPSLVVSVLEKVTDELNLSLKKEESTIKEELKSIVEVPISKEEVNVPLPIPEIKIIKEEEITDANLSKEANIEAIDPLADKIEPISVIKENEKFIDEIDNKAETESVLSDSSKERLSADTVKDDAIDSKEDSDYWSAKEVNIDSVIKKVDALCSADDLSDRSSDVGKDDWSEDGKIKDGEDKDESKISEKDVDSYDEGVDNEDRDMLLTRSGRGRGGRTRGRKPNRGNTAKRGSKVAITTAIPSKELAVPVRRGGRGGRPRNDRKISKSESDDVYEFRDDSDDTGVNKDRPRLILTIKSPAVNSANGGAACQQTTAQVKEVIASKELISSLSSNAPTSTICISSVISSPEEFASPIANTRKSRRLQERDGTRNTVDDTIEDVIKNKVTQAGGVAVSGTGTRRSARQTLTTATTNTTFAVSSPVSSTKVAKSPRVGRKSKDRRASDTTTDDSSEEKSVKSETAMSPQRLDAVPTPEPVKIVESVDTAQKEVIKEKPHEGLKAAVLRRVKNDMSLEPQTLIDPVTGLLTEMRECEENRYIPIADKSAQIASSIIATTTVTANTQPAVVATTTVTSTAAISVASVPSAVTVVSSSTPAELVTATTPTVVQAPNKPPQSLKAHVLSSQNQIQTQHQQVASTKPIVGTTSCVQSAIGTCKPTQAPIIVQPTGAIVPSTPITQALNVAVTGPFEASHLSPRLTVKQAKPIALVQAQQTVKVIQSPLSPMSPITINQQQQLLQEHQAHVQQLQQQQQQAINKMVQSQQQSIVGQQQKVPSLQQQMHVQHQQQALHAMKQQQQQQAKQHHVMNAIKVQQQQQQQMAMKHQQSQSTLAQLKQQQALPSSQTNPVPQSTNLAHLKQPSLSQPSQAHMIIQQQPPLSTQTSPPPLKVASQAGLGPVVVIPGGPPPGVRMVQQRGNAVQQQQQQVQAAAQQRLIMQATVGVPAYEASLLGDRNLYNRSRSPPPAHQNSPSPQAEGTAHFQPGPLPMRTSSTYKYPPSSMIYQPYIRQPYHLSRSPGQEGEEAPDSMPPLELRRPGSVGIALTGRPQIVPHSLQSPHDRSTDSPQIGQVYSPQLPPPHPAARMHPNHNAPPQSHSIAPSYPRFYDQPSPLPAPHLQTTHQHPPTPPPAHRQHQPPPPTMALVPPPTHIPDRPLSAAQMVGSVASVMGGDQVPQVQHMAGLVGTTLGAAGNLMGAVARHVGLDSTAAGGGGRGLQVATPPYASQVPPQTTESLLMLLKQLPCMWQGLLALKNGQAAVQMYFVSGNNQVAAMSLPKNIDGSTPPLRIFQRMRLEPPQVEGVARKMQMEQEHCMLLALPCGRDHMDVIKQSQNLKEEFITYLQSKQAAGIINVAAPGTNYPPAYVVHIFPSCDFVNESLRRIAPNLLERVADTAHLLIVITTV